MSFGGLEIKVSEEQLHEAAASMMVVVLASQRGVSVAQARQSKEFGESGTLAKNTSSGEMPFAAAAAAAAVGVCRDER